MSFEFGIYSLGERITNKDGNILTAQQRIENIIQIGKWADEAGLDVFGIGEHHRSDFVTSSYAMILAALARETTNIKLTSTLSVVSTSDPVRLYEDFSTLDLLSNGRTEIILGRGAFLESFHLFGVSLDDYDAVFEEKLDLFMKLQNDKVTSWVGEFRPPLKNAQISPRALQPKIPMWIGVGGSPESAIRGGHLGLNMALGLLGGMPESVSYLTNLYWQSAREAGHDLSKLKVSVSGHGYIAENSKQAIEEFVPHYNQYNQHFMKDRGIPYNPVLPSQLTPETTANRILAVGSAEDLVEKYYISTNYLDIRVSWDNLIWEINLWSKSKRQLTCLLIKSHLLLEMN